MHGGPEAFRPFDGPSGEVLRPQWEALHSEAGDLWKPELKEVNPERLGHIAEAQGVFARYEAQSCFDALFDSYDANSVQGRSARTRLLSCACSPTSAWLHTLPCTQALELKSGEVRTGLCHRLGLSMLPSNAPAVQYTCGATLCLCDGDHGMRCPSLDAQTTLRNDILTFCAGSFTGRASHQPSSHPSAASQALPTVRASRPMAPPSARGLMATFSRDHHL
jgi:hypothetical protein